MPNLGWMWGKQEMLFIGGTKDCTRDWVAEPPPDFLKVRIVSGNRAHVEEYERVDGTFYGTIYRFFQICEVSE